MCFHCEKKYAFGHRSKNPKSFKFKIMLEEDGVSEPEFYHEDGHEIETSTDIIINSMAGVV